MRALILIFGPPFMNSWIRHCVGIYMHVCSWTVVSYCRALNCQFLLEKMHNLDNYNCTLLSGGSFLC